MKLLPGLLFVTMVLYCEVNDEYAFFEKVWKLLTDDIVYQFRDIIGCRSYEIPETDLRDYLLDDLTNLFAKNGAKIRDYNLPHRSNPSQTICGNRLIQEELSYDLEDLLSQSEEYVSSLNSEQLHAFNCITDAVLNGKPGLFFVSGYGGTCKTYLWNAIVSFIRAQKKIVLTVASSGVASLLLPGGRTAHSRFKIPCDIDDDTVCDIKRGSMLAELIESTSLVIWDEALMTHRKAFETLDRSFRDTLAVHSERAEHRPFGGKVVVLGGDLRQILPVIEGGTRAQIVDAATVNSPLWNHVTVLHLTKNMRLLSPNVDSEAQKELAAFSQWILDIGEGKIEATATEGETEAAWIKIPQELLLMPNDNKIACLIDTVYPDLSSKYNDITYLGARAILRPTNEAADSINDHIVSLIPGEQKQHLSYDKVTKVPGTHDSYDLLYPVEFLNSLNGNNFPQHELNLKKGVPVMLLRNLNPSDGLCNGIRLIITALGDMIIEAQNNDWHSYWKSCVNTSHLPDIKKSKVAFCSRKKTIPYKSLLCYDNK